MHVATAHHGGGWQLSHFRELTWGRGADGDALNRQTSHLDPCRLANLAKTSCILDYDIPSDIPTK